MPNYNIEMDARTFREEPVGNEFTRWALDSEPKPKPGNFRYLVAVRLMVGGVI